MRRAFPLAAVALTLAAAGVGVWADTRFGSSVLAIVGLPVALGGAAAATRRSVAVVALAAFTADLALVAYWIYDFVSTIHRGT